MWTNPDGGQARMALIFWPPNQPITVHVHIVLIHHAVGSGGHPLLAEQHASTMGLTALAQGHLPGLGSSWTWDSVNNLLQTPVTLASCAADPRTKDSNKISKGAAMVTSESLRGCQQGRALFCWGINEAPSQLQKVRSDPGTRLSWEPGIDVCFF